MKTVGIACDSYKVNAFKKELMAKGFTDFEVLPGVAAKTNFIQVKVENHQVHDIHRICMKVQVDTTRSN